ncbi:hypothetical protein KR009_003058 [Drosophila setifemur]|nr:hypothetical protein KR009_003058 [Drosophila setifemur]
MRRAGGDTLEQQQQLLQQQIHYQQQQLYHQQPSPRSASVSADSTPRLGTEHMRLCIQPNFHPGPMCSRTIAANAACAAAAAVQVAQTRQETLECLTRRWAENSPEARPYDMVASVSPQTPPYYGGVVSGPGPGAGPVGLPGGAPDQQRRLRLNTSLLSATLCLIREMDPPTLEALSHAIHEHVTNQPY